MASNVTREEFDELADEVAGEKMVTRHILEQARRNGDDLSVLKTRVSRVEEKVDNLDRKVGGLDYKVNGLDQKVTSLENRINTLIKDLPQIIGDTMRGVLSERDGKK